MKILSNRFSSLADSVARPRVLLVLGAVLVILLFVTAATITLTSTPTFCGLCHEMSADITAWKTSSHAEVTCYGCHSEGSLPEFVLHKLESLKELYLHATDSFEKPINAHSHYATKMSNEPCRRCHSLNRKVTSSKGIVIKHRKHDEKDITCVTCHNRVGHPNIKGYVGEKRPKDAEIRLVLGGDEARSVEHEPYQDHLKMRSCMKCHTGGEGSKEGPEECSACHTPKFELKPKNHFAAGFLVRQPVDGVKQIHGKIANVDLGYCRMCHLQKSCVDCHGLPLPHEVVWPGIHGKNAVADASLCFKCHKRESCTKCHGVAYPHPSEWTTVHGKEASLRGKGDGCGSCHRVSHFCQGCHAGVEMPHPRTWFAQHPLYLQDNPSEACVGCHSRDQCEVCHASHAVHNRQTLYDFSRISAE